MAPRPHPFRFGLQSFSASSKAEWTERARKAEDLGYSALMLADHYIGPGPALTATGHPVQEIAAVPAITLAAAVTSTIKVGCRVMCIDYRNPVVLAKEMATIDLFSEGRLELGLGAGWLRGEYEAMGITLDPPGVRIQRLAEVIALMKATMGDGEVDVRGTAGVHAVGFEGLPKPVQRPHPPIMVGGGARKVLTLAGREADIVSLNFDNSSGVIGPKGIGSSTAEMTAQKIGWIRDGAGDRFDDLEIEIGAYFTVVTEHVDPVAGQFAAMFGLTPEAVVEHPHVLLGSVDAICDELQRRREAYGISYITVGDGNLDAFAPVVARLTGT
jgi:probable F420-dependent oxidoreductase